MALGINVLYGKLLKPVEGLDADFTGYIIGDAVRQGGHRPLTDGRDADQTADIDQDTLEGRETYRAVPDDQIDRLSRQNRDPKC